MERLRSCAVLGQSPMRFAWGFDEEDGRCQKLKLELAQQIMVLRRLGVTEFSVACDPGVGLYAAEAVEALQQTDEELVLLCVTSYEEQATKWAPYLRGRYFDVLAGCTYASCVSSHPTPGAQLEAYKRTIVQSDIVLAVYDADSARGDDVDTAMEFAAEVHRPIIRIHPDTLAVSAVLQDT